LRCKIKNTSFCLNSSGAFCCEEQIKTQFIHLIEKAYQRNKKYQYPFSAAQAHPTPRLFLLFARSAWDVRPFLINLLRYLYHCVVLLFLSFVGVWQYYATQEFFRSYSTGNTDLKALTLKVFSAW
jgi:hypothetical protein